MCFNVSNRTHLSVSLELHVEQLKHLTHQALFNADTTFRQKRRIKRTCELFSIHPEIIIHIMQMLSSVKEFISNCLTVSLNDAVAVVTDVSEELEHRCDTHIQIMSRISGTVRCS